MGAWWKALFLALGTKLEADALTVLLELEPTLEKDPSEGAWIIKTKVNPESSSSALCIPHSCSAND